MKKNIILLISFLCVIMAYAQQEISVKDVSVAKGGTGQVEVSIANPTNYTAFQFDLKLPAGVSVKKDGATLKGTYEGDTRKLEWKLFNESTNTYRFLSYDMGNAALKADGSVVATITVEAAETAETGDITSKVKISESLLVYSGEEYKTQLGNSGDVNNDGKLNIKDVTAAADSIMDGKKSGTADVNEDQKVNALDIVTVVNLIKETNYFLLGTEVPTKDNYTTLDGVVTTYTSLGEAMEKASRVYSAGEWAVVLYPFSWGEKDELVFLDSANKK